MLESPDGSRAETVYEPVTGRQTQRVYAAGNDKPTQTITTLQDINGNETERSVSFGDETPKRTATKNYDSVGRVRTSTTDTVTTTSGYTAAGRVSQRTISSDSRPGPAVSATEETDGFQRVTLKTLQAPENPDATARTLGYDTSGRMSTETDQTGAVTRFGYGHDGGLDTVTNPDGTVARNSLDSAGRVEHTWTVAPDNPDMRHEWRQRSYHHDTGLLEAIWDPAHPVDTRITYTYSPDGAPQTVKYPDGKQLSWVFNDNAEMTSSTDTSGAITHYTYAGNGKVEHASNTEADGTPIAKVSYRYDTSGNLARIIRENGTHTAYEYNDAGHVTTETHTTLTPANTHEVLTKTYTYDQSGNISRETTTTSRDGASSTTSSVRSYDLYDRLLTSIDDADGNPETTTDRTTHTYEYDLATQLTRATTNHPDGRHDETRYALDAAGRPQTITTNDEVHSQEYDTAGRLIRNPNGTTYTYTGAYTGHYRLGTRYYNATTTTFTTPDTANTHARYAYAAGNPRKYTDPTGQTPTKQSWINLGITAAVILTDIASTILTAGLMSAIVVTSLTLAAAAAITETLSIIDKGFVDFIPDEHANKLDTATFGLNIAGAVPHLSPVS